MGQDVGAVPSQRPVRRDPGRLVDDDEVPVVVDDPEARHLARHHRRHGGGRQVDLEQVAPRDPVGLPDHASVQLHTALADQLGQPAAGHPGHPGRRGVHALPGEAVGHEVDAHAGCTRVERPSRPTWVMDVSQMIVTAANVMHMSATLKIAKDGNWRKSMT